MKCMPLMVFSYSEIMFRNDDFMSSQNNRRPYHGTAVYSKLPFVEGYPYHRDYKRIEAASGDESRNKLNKSNGGQI